MADLQYKINAGVDGLGELDQLNKRMAELKEKSGTAKVGLSQLEAQLSAAKNAALQSGQAFDKAIGQEFARNIANAKNELKQLQSQMVATSVKRELLPSGGGGGSGALSGQLGKVTDSLKQLPGVGALMNPVAAGVGLITASILALGNAVDTVVSKIGGLAKLQDVADTTGTDAGKITLLRDAFLTSGVSMDDWSQKFNKLNKDLAKEDGTGKLAQSLKAIGISFAEFKSMDAVDRTKALADALDRFKNDPEKAALLDNMVKGFSQLSPLFKDLAQDGLASAKITSEQIQKVADLDDSYQKLSRDWKSKGFFSSGNIAGAADEIQTIVDGVRALAEELGLMGSKGGETFKNIAGFIGETIADIKNLIVLFKTFIGDSTSASEVLSVIGNLIKAAWDVAVLTVGNALYLFKLTTIELSGILKYIKAIGTDTKFSDVTKSVTKDISDATSAIQKFNSQVLSAKDLRNNSGDSRRLDKKTNTAKTSVDTSFLNKADKASNASSRTVVDNTDEEEKKRSLSLAEFYMKEQDRIFKLGLVSSNDYYTGKINAINAEAEAQAKAYAKQVARLEAEASKADTEDKRKKANNELEKAKTEEQKKQLDFASRIRDADLARTASQFDAKRMQSQREITALDTEQLRIQQEMSNGSISQIEGQEKLNALKREQLQIQIDQKTLELNGGGLTPDQIKATTLEIEKMRVQMQGLRPVVVDFATQVDSLFRDKIGSAIGDVLTGTKSLRSAFSSMLKDIANQIIRSNIDKLMRQMLSPSGSGFSFGSAATSGFGSGAEFGNQDLGMYLADGGPVTGPGTGTSDSIPAMLSNGEFVVKASSVSKYGTEFLHAINSGVLAAQRFASGGFVSSMPTQRFANGGAVVASNDVNIQVVNNSSQPVAARQQRDPSTGVIQLILEDLSKGGPISRGINSVTGTRRAAA